jgi:protein-S-isoprenylcysteine O-methyltransferase Ste14
MKFSTGLILVGCMLFLPAGTLKYWNAWVFFGALFIPMLFALIYLIRRDPELLEKRMRIKVKEKKEKAFVKFGIIFLLASYILPGFDYRFHWSKIPLWLVVVSTLVMLFGYLLFVLVLKQNSYASRIIEVQEKQKVIDTGLYRIVRHPMYMSMILLYLFSPLVLGSYYALIPILVFLFGLKLRIKNEEEVLKNGLEGYAEYMKKVKYRMIPFIW